MTRPLVIRPFVDYLRSGISASDALKLLNEHDCLSFPQLKSGLFPAANFDDLADDKTGMANAWLRDSASIGMALLRVGHSDEATLAVRGVLSKIDAVKHKFDEAIGVREGASVDRPPVRFTGQDSTPLYAWANAQNDALGYTLQFIGEAVSRGVIKLSDSEKKNVERIVLYLESIEYWQDQDSGHWEEVIKINASSIGTVVSGLRAVRDIFDDTTKITALIENGSDALAAILPTESMTLGNQRPYDAALLFLVEPRRVVSDDMAASIVAQSEANLKGEHGFRRYIGDSYWGPNYREHFQVTGRAADFSNPETMRLRDQYLMPGGEAQWTLFDPLLAMYYAHLYQKTADDSDARRAAEYMARALRAVIVHEKQDGETVWRIPELFFLENGEWVPNDHLGLLWAQANLLSALQVYEHVFGDALIRD